MTEKKTRKKRVTKKEQEEQLMKEVEQEAEKYVAEKKALKTDEYPNVVLPIRGYYRRLDYDSGVEVLQTMLNHVLGANLVPDGFYGDKTVEAVKEFELKYCVWPVNGIYGSKDQKAYNVLRGAE